MEQVNYKHKLLLARIEDLAISVRKYHRVAFTPFLDPAMLSKAEALLKSYNDLEYRVVGGYPEAERNVILIYPDWMDPDLMDEETVKGPISILRIGWDSRYYKVGHRDILGSILGLGIKREKVGDIIVESSWAYAITSKDISDYIVQNLTIVGKAPVTVEEVEAKDLKIIQKEGKIIKTTVSSLRLDCIASSGFGISRTKIVPYISNGMVQVNWEAITKPDRLLKEGDIISLRGKGRIKFVEMAGISKRNRYHVILERW